MPIGVSPSPQPSPLREGLLRTFFGVTGRFETFPYGAVMRNLRFSGELGIQGAAANWRFTLTPTLSLREREF